MTERKPNGGAERAKLFRSVIAETSETISAENLRRARLCLPPEAKRIFSPVPVYVAIERAVVLGSEETVDGNVFLVEPDRRLRPISGRDLVALDRDFPNFVRRWRLPCGGQW
jgi:hypothetical protein